MKCLFELREECPKELSQIVEDTLKERNVEKLVKICGLCIKATYAKSKIQKYVVVNTL